MSDGRGNSMNRYDYQFGITVNALGQRFFDEGEAKHAYTYAKTGRAVLNQPGGVAWQIYDQTGIDLFRHGRDYPATMVEAPTLAELAKKIGIEPEPFVHTVEEFNAACREDVAFMAGELDGKGTVGITPKKSNWAVPLTRGPFRAYPITAGVTFSFGGVQVDTQARVINTSYQPIEGLFASGDVDRAVLPQLPVLHRADPQRGVQPARRPQRRRDAREELKVSSMAKSHASPGPGVVEQLADWALGIRAGDLPQRDPRSGQAPAARHHRLRLCRARRGILARGDRDHGGSRRRAAMHRHRQRKDKTSAANAVLLNGALCRILDLNDYVNTKSGQIGGHPSDNIPVALAAGGAVRRKRPRDRRGHRCRLRNLRPPQGGDAARQRLGRHHGLGLRRARHGGAAAGARPLDARECAGALRRARADAAGRAPRRDLGREVGGECAGRAERACRRRCWRSTASPGRSTCSRIRTGWARCFPGSTAGVAHRAARRRLLPDGLPRQSLSLPRHRAGDRACRARHPPPGRRRREQARPHHGRDRRHAVAAAAEGRSRPHRPELARGRRPQLQFPCRGADRRRRLRPGPVRTTSAGTPPTCARSWAGWRSSAMHR